MTTRDAQCGGTGVELRNGQAGSARQRHMTLGTAAAQRALELADALPGFDRG